MPSLKFVISVSRANPYFLPLKHRGRHISVCSKSPWRPPLAPLQLSNVGGCVLQRWESP